MHRPRVVLVTGGAGFIGCNFVRYLLKNRDSVRVIVYDKLTYAGNLQSLDGLAERYGERYRFVKGDICDAETVRNVLRDEDVDTIVHLAAESHVDRSIDGPDAFLQTNVIGTYTLLQAARTVWAGRHDVRFHHVSTDEVYGSLGEEGYFTEETRYDPSSPYSATKAASDHLVMAWHRTFGIPVTLSNCSNNYGPYQFPEKLIPLVILKAVRGEAIPVYGRGENVRDWLYVEDHAEALLWVLERGRPGQTYNVGGDSERRNLKVVQSVCDILDRLLPVVSNPALCGPATIRSHRDLISFVPDRPGHDLRYAIDAAKLRTRLGWAPTESFATGIEKTVRWYLDNRWWWEPIRKQKYAGQRLGL